MKDTKPRAVPSGGKEKRSMAETSSSIGLLDSSGAITTPASGRRVYVLIFTSATLLSLAVAAECHSIFYVPSLLYGLVYWEWWGMILATLWAFGLRGRLLSNISPKIAAFHLAFASALGVSHLMLLGSLPLLDIALGFFLSWPGRVTSYLDLNHFGMELLLYGFASGAIGVVQSHLRAQQQTLRSLDLQRQLAAAQLQALQSQMEPHFLFNTLNAVTSLVDLGRNREASETLTHLNTILRGTLHRSTPEKIPFAEELKVTESYLAIQRTRFSDRLQVVIVASDEALHGLVPCFLLQPLVENAIRHGISPAENGGTVEAHIHRSGDQLELCVRDTGNPAKVASPGHGIGLRNTKKRLAHFYPDAHLFSAGPLPGGGYEVNIQIPYEPVIA